MQFGKSIATALAVAVCASVVGLSTAATAAPGAFEIQLGKTLVQKGLDKKIYQDLFGRQMPAGTALTGLNFRGELTTLGINYMMPGGGLPDVPTVGDQQSVENCGFEGVDSRIDLGAEVSNSATWSKEDSLSKSFETSVEMTVSYESPFGLSASATAGLSYTETGTTTTSQSKTKSKSRNYNLAKTITTQPGTMTKAQLVYSEKDANGIPYSARFGCSGKTFVTFTGTRHATPNNEVLVGFAGKCLDAKGETTDRGGAVTIYPCHGRDNQRWTYNASTREIKGIGGNCIDAEGDHNDNGTRIIMWTCNGGTNQKWTFESNGEIKGSRGKCIDVARFDSSDSAYTHLWDCKATSNQIWRTAPPTVTGSIDIERYLSAAERAIAVKGVFDGVYTSNASSFRVADVKLSDDYCKKVRAQLGISDNAVASRSLPKVNVSATPPKPGGTVVMTAKSAKSTARAYVVVRKPTAQALKSEKPLPATNAVK